MTNALVSGATSLVHRISFGRYSFEWGRLVRSNVRTSARQVVDAKKIPGADSPETPRECPGFN